MANEKPGEVARNVIEAEDEQRQVVSRITVEWFGFDRENNNVVQTSLVEGLVDTVNKWNEAKFPGYTERQDEIKKGVAERLKTR